MSTKDVTRFLHQPRKHYVAARLQQGRALLDSDVNEDARLGADDVRRTLLSVLGAGASPDAGFSLGRVLPGFGPVPTQTSPLRAGDVLPTERVLLGGTATNVHPVSLRAGSIYVGGMRFELGQPESIAFQRDFLQMQASDFPGLERSPSPSPYSPRSPRSPQYPSFRYLYYLNAWEQSITSVEDEELLERGLGGPDTTTRIRRMRRVELSRVPDDIDNCLDAWDFVRQGLEARNNSFIDRPSGELVSRGRLSLTFGTPSVESCAPCTPDPPAQYLGSENQALRIMLTSGNTFVWAYDNAAPLYRVRVTGLSHANPVVTVTMLNPPRDQEHRPFPNRVVEILPFAALLEGGEGIRPNDPHFQKVAAEVGVFLRVSALDPDGLSFALDTSSGLEALKALVHQWDPRHPAAAQLNISSAVDDSRFFYMRFWHSAESSPVEIPIDGSLNAQPLGDTGIIPVLRQPGRRGDTWLATLRPDTPERIVPFDLLTDPNGVPPQGPRHFYAPLALVDGRNLTVFGVEDCRTRMRRMTDRGCATFTVGDGVNSIGDFSSINDAIDSLPLEGGLISVGPGRYHEQLRILGRRGVIVQGCGEASVLQTPASALGELLGISSSESVSISGFRINVGEQPGLLVNNSGDVSLSGLLIVAGLVTGDAFSEEPGTSDAPLIAASDSQLLTLNEIVMVSQRRPAIAVSDGQGLTITKLSCQGIDASSALPAQAMILLDAVESVRIRASELTCFGQVGIGCTASVLGVELSGLSLFAGQHAVGEGHYQALTSIDIDGSQRVRIEHCRVAQEDALTEHAAIVVQGRELVLEDNQINGGVDPNGQSSLSAWGGIQIRGESTDVELRDNRIAGGLGHGITLGSLLWIPSPAGPPRREGAGFNQIGYPGHGDAVVEASFVEFEQDGVGFSPTLEGDLLEIRLIGNSVRGMASNGISVITVGGCLDQLVAVRRSLIERNTITGNLQRPSTDMVQRTDIFQELANPPGDTFTLPVLPFAGIVLAEVGDGIDIRDNVVVGNGSSQVLPQGGIFILAGDAIVISGNRVADNGGRAHSDSPASSDQPPAKGVRAGIAVLLAGVTPSVDLLSGLEAFLGATPPGLESAGVALQVMNNNVRQPEGRALQAVVVGPAMIDGNFFASLGNHGADEQGELGALGEVIFVMDLGKPWEAFSAETLAASEDGIFTMFTTPSRTRDYLTGIAGAESPHSPPRFIGLGGQLSFNNNQVMFDWQVLRLPGAPASPQFPISFFPVTLLTLDHLSLASNQFALRASHTGTSHWEPGVRVEPIAGHVLAQGATVCASRNRFSEQVGNVTLSLFSSSELMNLTAFNQSTHIVAAHKWSSSATDGPYTVNQQNQVMFFATDVGDTAPFAGVFRNLLDILWK